MKNIAKLFVTAVVMGAMATTVGAETTVKSTNRVTINGTTVVNETTKASVPSGQSYQSYTQYNLRLSNSATANTAVTTVDANAIKSKVNADVQKKLTTAGISGIKIK